MLKVPAGCRQRAGVQGLRSFSFLQILSVHFFYCHGCLLSFFIFPLFLADSLLVAEGDAFSLCSLFPGDLAEEVRSGLLSLHLPALQAQLRASAAAPELPVPAAPGAVGRGCTRCGSGSPKGVQVLLHLPSAGKKVHKVGNGSAHSRSVLSEFTSVITHTHTQFRSCSDFFFAVLPAPFQLPMKFDSCFKHQSRGFVRIEN